MKKDLLDRSYSEDEYPTSVSSYVVNNVKFYLTDDVDYEEFYSFGSGDSLELELYSQSKGDTLRELFATIRADYSRREEKNILSLSNLTVPLSKIRLFCEKYYDQLENRKIFFVYLKYSAIVNSGIVALLKKEKPISTASIEIINGIVEIKTENIDDIFFSSCQPGYSSVYILVPSKNSFLRKLSESEFE